MEGPELIKISNKHKIANYCSTLILVVLVSVSVFLVMWNAEWTLGDDNQFITTTVIGKIVKGWSGAGRFWPLGLFDCSILILIPYGYTFTMHMAYCSLTLIVSSVLMFNLIKKITNHWISIISLTVLFFSSAFMRIHMLCTFPERFMFTLLSFIMFCLWMAYKNQKIKYYVAALLASIYVTYTKEPTFGAMLIIALTNLMFGKLNKKQVYFYC